MRLALLVALALTAALPVHARPPDPPAAEETSDPPAVAEHELSLAERIARDPAKLAELERLSPVEAEQLLYTWGFHARPKQLAPPGDWRQWLVLAGRGFGKTRTGAEFVRAEVEAKRAGRIALVGPTAADTRDVMVEGESGILAISPPWAKPKYEPSKRRVTWPNGAQATLFSADEPDRLRGPQHDLAWPDELAAWRYDDAWDQLQFGLRLAEHPRAVITTTPRPTALVKSILADPRTVVTRGSTYENRRNLAKSFIVDIERKYAGTRLGRQELEAEILDDVPGALWTRGLIERLRVREAPELARIVVAVDPSVDAEGEHDECGIVIAGVGQCACKGARELHGFVLSDVSGQLSPNAWAQRVVTAYDTHEADRVVAEQNNGGALVEVNVRTVKRSISYKAVHAAKGKRTRAEPVAALYEQGKVHHVGAHPKLEDELATWDPLASAKSPNRLDALVWGVTDLMLPGSAGFKLYG